MKKKCTKCGKTKDISKFYKFKSRHGTISCKSQCKECVKKSKRKSNKLYYQRTKEERKNYNLEKAKEWRKKNPDYHKTKEREQYSKKYSYKYLRRPGIKEKRTKQYMARIKKDDKLRISVTMKGQIYRALKGKKAGRHWEDLVGYTLQDLMTHLESLFKPGMTFENHGEWHIDHKKPKKLFNYESVEDPEFKKCWALKNLQPLWAWENLSKGSKYEEVA